MIFPSLEEIRTQYSDFDLVPVALETLADMETPVSVFKRFKDTSPYCFLLDSVEGGEKWARYSFIGRDPLLVIRAQEQDAIVETRGGGIERRTGSPYDILQDILSNYRGAQVPGIPRLSGGAVGFFGYDLVRGVENLPDAPPDDLQLPDCHFMIVDEMIVFDHLRQKLLIVVNMPTKGDLELNYKRAVERALSIHRTINEAQWRASNHPKKINTSAVRSNMTKEHFCSMVEKAKKHIYDGDIFQIVLSQRLMLETDADPLDVYRHLRVTNPSPYLYYLKFDSYSLVGASPEMLVRCEDGRVETCPIAGTRPRGKTPDLDDQLETELLADKKELAEHVMLVDLGRNDVGKVSAFGSVRVAEYQKVVRYSRVMHLVSTVEGRLREGLTPFDALRAVLPAGTLSGAPKIRAMQIIDSLEPTRRGAYGGAIGYISFGGNLDSCITIRTIIFKNSKAYVQAGAGIVADSVPETEFEETLNKAGALIQSIQEAGEIYDTNT